MIAGKQGTVEVQHIHRVRGSGVPEADRLFGSLRGEAGNGRLEADQQVQERQGPIGQLQDGCESGRHLRSGLGRSGKISFPFPVLSSLLQSFSLSLSVPLRSNSEQLLLFLSPASVPSTARRGTGQFLYLDCLILPAFDVNQLSSTFPYSTSSTRSLFSCNSPPRAPHPHEEGVTRTSN